VSPAVASAVGGRSLVGEVVRLDPSTEHDAVELFTALDHDVVWASGYNGGPGARPDSADGWTQRIAAAAEQDRAMYTVRRCAGGEVIGTSSLGDERREHERIHLGWTAYTPRWWGTAVNPECKLLLLGHAFDDCGFGRVKIQTDLLNERSQAAIAKLGATREGVLRRHMRRGDGSFRDTVVFSIVIDEWPAVRARLTNRLRDLAEGG
jgi:RimJ/RimL family protein N-acetyltransferase